MTGLLRDLMHDRADALDAPDLDLDRIVSDGERRIGRRRTAVVGAGAAAAVLAALVVPGTLAGRDAPVVQDPLAAAFAGHAPTYAVGSTVHIDGRTFDVGHRVTAFVQTDLGVVFADRSGVVRSSDGLVSREVGRAGARSVRLRTDGALTAWVEWDGRTPTFAVLDQATGEVTRDALSTGPRPDPVADGEDPPQVYAVDDRTVYVRDQRGLVAWDVDTDEQTVLGAEARTSVDVTDASGGLLAYWARSADASGSDKSEVFRVGPTLQEGLEIPGYPGSLSSLSPDGRWLLVEDSDQNIVYDTATGAAMPFDQGDYFFLVGYQWTGGDTYAALGLATSDQSRPVDLLTCSVPDGSCTLDEAGVFTIDEGFALPVGEELDS